MKFKKFNATEDELDSLYSNPLYDNKFKVQTKYDEEIYVTLGWEQGRCNNYRFYVNDSQYYHPDEIEFVEEKIN